MVLRDLHTLADYRRVVELEKEVWGYTDAEDVVPVPILAVTVKRGGILIGAFDAGEMIGFVYSMPAFKDGARTQWSHMLGVLNARRSSGLGRQLKLAQRERALAMGVSLIEWTFDPMQALNAHLNFQKLGIVAEEYEENIYGESSSPLHRGTPTDRLVAEWPLDDPRVVRRIAPDADPQAAGATARDDEGSIPAVNETGLIGRLLACGALRLDMTDLQLRITIPTGFGEMQQADPALARSWRDATRTLFTTYFPRGYRAVDFVLERPAGRGHYILERPR